MVLEIYILIPLFVILCGITFYFGWFVNSRATKNKLMSADEQAKKILDDAEKSALTLKKEKLLEVKDEWYRKKQEFDADYQTRKNKLKAFEKQLLDKDETLDKKLDSLGKKEKNVEKLEKDLVNKNNSQKEKEEKLENLIHEQNIKLEN